MYEPPGVKLSIGSLDDASLSVEAQYNPKELAFQKQVPWSQQTEKIGYETDPFSWDNKSGLALNYGHDGPRSLTLELLFDGYETDESVEDMIATLEKLASPTETESDDEELRRAHLCVVVWGFKKKFPCVIESLATKYTMFGRDGKPLRAICTVTVKEINIEAMAGLARTTTHQNILKREKRAREAARRRSA